MVAMTSDSHSAPDDRLLVDRLIGSSSNMMLASTAPAHPPTVCAMAYRIVSVVLIVPNIRSTRVTAGLKCAPDTAPNIRINPISAPAVAAAFSSS